MLKNAGGDVLLDGYILLHINYSPDNLEVVYPEKTKEFDLCNPVNHTYSWSEFSSIVLTQYLDNEQRLAFDDYYRADCVDGGTIQNDDWKYVSADAKFIGNTADGHSQYQLRVFNFGDLYGENVSADAQAAMKNGDAARYEETSVSGFQSNKGLGTYWYNCNGEGTTNHTFTWQLSQEELEYLTHHKNATKDKPITVTRWIRYVAQDSIRMRSVNNYSAPYPYVYVKLTFKIYRKDESVKYGVKNADYWYHWNSGSRDGWSAIIWDIQAPRDGYLIDRFNRNIPSTLVENKLNITKAYKYYFAPKKDTLTFYTLTRASDANTVVSVANASGISLKTPPTIKTVKSVLEGFEELPASVQTNLLKSTLVKKEMRIITPLNSATFNIYTEKKEAGIKMYTSSVPAYVEGERNGIYDQLFCKYVYPHDYVNVSTTLNFIPANVTVTAQDKHTWVEATLKKDLFDCAIDYNQGAFSNSKLYSFNPDTKEYKLIANLNQTTGEIELIKDDQKAFEEAQLVLNAYGYKKNHKDIDKGNGFDEGIGEQNDLSKDLCAWVGVIANNGCDVAIYTYPEQTDNELNTFRISWQRPININAEPIKPKLDANTNENYIHLIDYLKLYDWRGDYSNQGYMYYDPDQTRLDNHYWFWSYYRIKSITLDMATNRVLTNLHYGEADVNDFTTLNKVSNMVDLKAYSSVFNGFQHGDLSVYSFDLDPFNSKAQEPAIEQFMGYPNMVEPSTLYDANKEGFGVIYYQNNGDNVTEFDVYIPITIEYEWGWLSRIVGFHIDSTHGVHE